MEGNLNCLCMDWDLVEFISMQVESVCVSASPPRAGEFQALPHSGRSVVPYGLGPHFHISTV